MEQQGFKCAWKANGDDYSLFSQSEESSVARLIRQICIQVTECGEEKDELMAVNSNSLAHPAQAEARLIGLRMHACTNNQHKSTWRISQSP